MPTLTRFSASFSAIPRPMPREPPVMTACLPSSDMSASRIDDVTQLPRSDLESYAQRPAAPATSAAWRRCRRSCASRWLERPGKEPPDEIAAVVTIGIDAPRGCLDHGGVDQG